MRRTPLVLGAALALAAATVAVARPRTAEPPYRITAMRAQLFYSDRGTFSADVLAAPGKALWNTPIGEGDAGGPSDATLVVVLTGPPGGLPDDAVVSSASARYHPPGPLPVPPSDGERCPYASSAPPAPRRSPFPTSARTPPAARTAAPASC